MSNADAINACLGELRKVGIHDVQITTNSDEVVLAWNVSGTRRVVRVPQRSAMHPSWAIYFATKAVQWELRQDRSLLLLKIERRYQEQRRLRQRR